MLAWIALAAMDVMPQAASLDLPLVTNAAASAPSHEPIISLVDLDADGKADFANPTNSFVRSVDGYGSGSFGAHRDGVRGGRAHHGADYISVPGETVRAPINGAITRIGYAYRRNVSLRFIEVRDANTQNTARVFYVAPTVAIGDTVFAGQEIGSAQSLQTRYPGITNHVHVEIDDARGKAIDPETVLPAPVTNYVFNAGMRPVQTASQQPS
ncbi:MAG: peptidoglycan DD-metalloendopeptidase family protein [Caulobacterales bacterium]